MRYCTYCEWQSFLQVLLPQNFHKIFLLTFTYRSLKSLLNISILKLLVAMIYIICKLFLVLKHCVCIMAEPASESLPCEVFVFLIKMLTRAQYTTISTTFLTIYISGYMKINDLIHEVSSKMLFTFTKFIFRGAQNRVFHFDVNVLVMYPCTHVPMY